MNEEISRIHVWTTGDPSVGIGGESAVINADGDFLIDMGVVAEEDQAKDLEVIRNAIADAFAIIWDERPNVVFDFEQVEPEVDTEQPAEFRYLVMTSTGKVAMYDHKPIFENGASGNRVGGKSQDVENPPGWLKPQQLWERGSSTRWDNGTSNGAGAFVWDGYWWSKIADHNQTT